MRDRLLALVALSWSVGCDPGGAPADAPTGLDAADVPVVPQDTAPAPVDAPEPIDASTGASDYAGALALSPDGRTALVGYPLDGGGVSPPGRVDVWTRTPDGFAVTASLRPPAGEAAAYFGSVVALDGTGTRALVSAVDETHVGTVHVFAHDATGWHREALLDRSEPSVALGRSLALTADGGLAFVGAPLAPSDDGGLVAPGLVHVYARDGSSWSRLSTIRRPDAGTGDQFGTALAATPDGSRLVVGCWATCAPSILVRVGDTWTEEARLAPTGVAVLAAVSIDAAGDRVVVGLAVEHESIPPGSGPDAFVVVDRVATPTGPAWVETGRVERPIDPLGAGFGTRVAMSAGGDRIVVSAPDEGGGPGAIFLYERALDAWEERSRTMAAHPERNFGWVLAVDEHATLALATCRPHGWDVIDSEVHVVPLP